jgi:hypothetical protein
MRKAGEDSQEETIKHVPEHYTTPCQKEEIIRLPLSLKGDWHKNLRTFIHLGGESGIMGVDH